MVPRQSHPTDAQVEEALETLREGRAVPADSVGELEGLEHPGLYAWFVDRTGAEQLADGLGGDVAAGLIYGGQAGATKWPSGSRGSASLSSRLSAQHLNGRIRGSTFRLTLAAVLAKSLKLEASGSKRLAASSERRLSEWMLTHLSVSAQPFPNADALGELERMVLDALDPPLNLNGRVPSPLRSRLSELRSQLSRADQMGPSSKRHDMASSPPRLVSASSGRPTLHDEIAAILRGSGHTWMTTAEIAEAVNSRGRYLKGDGSPVTDFQIHGRTKNYTQLFVRDGSRVRLK